MMTLNKRLMAAAAVLALSSAFAARANATIVTITYTGTVSSGSSSGIFGTGSLNGDAYVATYTLNTANGIRQGYPSYDKLAGGSEFVPGLSQVDVAAITINGITKIINGSYYGVAITDPSSPLLGVEARDTSSSGNYLNNYEFDVAPVSLTTDLATTATAHMSGEVSFSNTTGSAFALFNAPGTVSVSAAPEPATWGLMLLGIGLTGGMLRMRGRAEREGQNLQSAATA